MMASAPPITSTQLKIAAHCTPRFCHSMNRNTAAARAKARMIQGQMSMVVSGSFSLPVAQEQYLRHPPVRNDQSHGLFLRLGVGQAPEEGLVVAQVQQKRELVLRQLAMRHPVLQLLHEIEHLADALDARALDEGPHLAARHGRTPAGLNCRSRGSFPRVSTAWQASACPPWSA